MGSRRHAAAARSAWWAPGCERRCWRRGCFGGSAASLTPFSLPDGEGRAGARHAQGDGCSGAHGGSRTLTWLRAAFSSWLNCARLMHFYSSADNTASPHANKLRESDPNPSPSLSAPAVCGIRPPPTRAARQGCLWCLVRWVCLLVPSSALLVAAQPC